MDARLHRLRDIVQEDIGGRGLRADPASNLITARADDFAAACASIARTPRPVIAVVTGFYIPTANPPAAETDGPLGAVYLARGLTPLGVRVLICSDAFCETALRAGLESCGLQQTVPLVTLPGHADASRLSEEAYWNSVESKSPEPLTHLIALERVGPSHTLESLQRQQGGEALGQTYLDFLDQVPPEHQDRCHTMRGRDITAHVSPAHRLFEAAAARRVATIGIGDGGNEIGMGKIAWDIIQRNIPGGGLVACRVPTDQLIVCGISNWGAYALARGVWLLRGQSFPAALADAETERRILQTMVERGPLVDGVTAQTTVSVDGLTFADYIRALPELATACDQTGGGL
jgi:D-glutamate cyclase